MLREMLKNKLEIPLKKLYNNSMLNMKEKKNKELVVKLSMCGEWFCRGDRGWEEYVESVNFDKIRKIWNSRNDDDYEEDRDDLNSIENYILNGDFGFIWDDDESYENSKRGISGCMSRVDELLEGKSVGIECEEEILMIGSIVDNDLDIDFCKWKIELLENWN